MARRMPSRKSCILNGREGKQDWPRDKIGCSVCEGVERVTYDPHSALTEFGLRAVRPWQAPGHRGIGPCRADRDYRSIASAGCRMWDLSFAVNAVDGGLVGQIGYPTGISCSELMGLVRNRAPGGSTGCAWRELGDSGGKVLTVPRCLTARSARPLFLCFRTRGGDGYLPSRLAAHAWDLIASGSIRLAKLSTTALRSVVFHDQAGPTPFVPNLCVVRVISPRAVLQAFEQGNDIYLNGSRVAGRPPFDGGVQCVDYDSDPIITNICLMATLTLRSHRDSSLKGEDTHTRRLQQGRFFAPVVIVSHCPPCETLAWLRLHAANEHSKPWTPANIKQRLTLVVIGVHGNCRARLASKIDELIGLEGRSEWTQARRACRAITTGYIRRVIRTIRGHLAARDFFDIGTSPNQVI